jgi:hypothetical protein
MDTSLEDFLKEIDANRKSFLEELEELVEPVICDPANCDLNGNEELYHGWKIGW